MGSCSPHHRIFTSPHRHTPTRVFPVKAMLNMGLDAVRTRWVLPLDPAKLGAFFAFARGGVNTYTHTLQNTPVPFLSSLTCVTFPTQSPLFWLFRAALGPETYAQVRRALRAALAQQAAEDGEVNLVLEA